MLLKYLSQEVISPLLRKTSIVFLPMCTGILIVFHQRVCCPNRLVHRGFSVPKKAGRKAPMNATQSLTGCCNLLWGGAAVSTKAKGPWGGVKLQSQWGYIFSEPPSPPLFVTSRNFPTPQGQREERMRFLKAQWDKHFWGYCHCCILPWSL